MLSARQDKDRRPRARVFADDENQGHTDVVFALRLDLDQAARSRFRIFDAYVWRLGSQGCRFPLPTTNTRALSRRHLRNDIYTSRGIGIGADVRTRANSRSYSILDSIQ